MSDTAPTVLLVEDSRPLAFAYQEFLQQTDYDCLHVETLGDARKAIANQDFAAVLLDMKLPDGNGIELLQELGHSHPGLPIVIITGEGSINKAIEAMRVGAADYLIKPLNKDKLTTALEAVQGNPMAPAIEEDTAQPTTPATTSAATTPVKKASPSGARKSKHRFVGRSPAMRSVFRILDAAANSDATVFVTGESGTGKELCADAVHRASARRDKPFVAINCAAIPKDLIESELFGHVKGAFTGATADRMGAVQRAHGGTLFLDELCEMDINLQTKLLRFIQTGGFQKVGASAETSADVRIVCATNRDPLEEVQLGRFREDLYFRLYVIPVHLPPLRDRGEDIIELARHFLAEYSTMEGRQFDDLSDSVIDLFQQFAWPGNVRQLQNVIRQAVVLHEGERLEDWMVTLQAPVPTSSPAQAFTSPAVPVPPTSAGPVPMPTMDAAGNVLTMAEVEWNYIQFALTKFNGNVPKVAAALEISPSTIYRRKKQFSS